MLHATYATGIAMSAYGPADFPTASAENAVRRALAEDATDDDMTGTGWPAGAPDGGPSRQG